MIEKKCNNSYNLPKDDINNNTIVNVILVRTTKLINKTHSSFFFLE